MQPNTANFFIITHLTYSQPKRLQNANSPRAADEFKLLPFMFMAYIPNLTQRNTPKMYFRISLDTRHATKICPVLSVKRPLYKSGSSSQLWVFRHDRLLTDCTDHTWTNERFLAFCRTSSSRVQVPCLASRWYHCPDLFWRQVVPVGQVHPQAGHLAVRLATQGAARGAEMDVPMKVPGVLVQVPTAADVTSVRHIWGKTTEVG